MFTVRVWPHIILHSGETYFLVEENHLRKSGENIDMKTL